jgi:hypothetical protein
MVGRWNIRLSILIVALGYAMPLSAGGPIVDFLASIPQDFKQRNSWPDPYINPARAAVGQTMATQTAAGWERQNLLSDFHFVPGGSELTEAGRLRVQWILDEAYDPYRQIYVHRAGTPQETALRMQAVQRVVAQSAYAANVPVLESTRIDDGWPASKIDTLDHKSNEVALPPKLMGASSSGISK